MPVRAHVAPEQAEVRRKVDQIFQGAVEPVPFELTGPEASVVAGDFTGDGSEDLAVVVIPVPARIKDITDPLANWILQAPQRYRIGEDSKPVGVAGAAPRPPVVRADEPLFAIIHGYGADGWRNPAATQTFVVANAVGRGIGVEKLAQIRANLEGVRMLPPLRGDVIHEILHGHPGFLFWTGARYDWFQ